MADTITKLAEVAESAANKSTYVGGTLATIGGLTANEIAAFGGLALAVVGFLLNWWYKHQHLKLARKRAAYGLPPLDDAEEA